MTEYVKQKFHKNFILILAAITIAGVHIWWQGRPVPVLAQSFEQINVTLSLFDVKNEPVNGKYQVRFAVYTTDRTESSPFPSDADAASRIWEETQEIEVRNGILRAYLGSGTALPQDIFSEGADEYFLGIRIGDDSEIVPRKKLAAVPYAFNARNAGNAQTLGGFAVGTDSGNIPVLGKGGKVDIKLLPTGTGTKQLVLGNDGRLHDQNTDTGTDATEFNIGSGSAVSENFSLSVSSASTKPQLRYNGALGIWQISNDGSSFSQISSGSTSTDLSSGVTGTLPVANGGTGATTLTQNGVLFGNGTAAISAVVGTDAQFLVADGSGVPTFVSMSGDATITNTGILTIGTGAITGAKLADSTIEEVDLEVTNAATDDYILSYDAASGGFTWIANTGGSGSSKFTDAGTFTYLTATTDDLVLGSSTTDSGFFFDVSASTLAFEGSTANAFETTLGVTDPTADRTVTIPNASGTVVTTGNLTDITAVGTVVSGTWNGSIVGTAYGGTGTSTSFTQGSVVFASSSGVYSQDNANFFWDDTNNRLGLGDTTPDAVLDLNLISTSSAGSAEYGQNIIVSDTGVMTSGSDSTFGQYIGMSRTGATGGSLDTYGSYILAESDDAGAGTSVLYGQYVAVGDADTVYGGYYGSDSGSSETYYGVYSDIYYQYASSAQYGVYSRIVNDWSSPASYGIYADVNGVQNSLMSPADVYGLYSKVNAGSGVVGYGLYVNAGTGLGTEYAGIFVNGNVGIGDTTPSALLTVGNGDLFRVNSSGAIASATGITSSGTVTFSGLSTAGIVTNTAGGVLGTTTSVPVANGGTGTTTLAANGVLLGNGVSAITATTGTSGQLLVVSGANVPTFVTLSGDASLSNTGVLSIGLSAIVGAQIANNTIEEVDLEATNAPTDGYILAYDDATGGFTWTLNTGGTGSSKFTDAGTYIYLTETTDDVVFGDTTTDSGFFFDVSASTLAFEGSTANAFETTLGVTDPTADRTVTIPNASGTVVTTGNLTDITAVGTVVSGTWQGTEISVASGGTGLTTLPTNGVLIGNGTSSISSANGTSGQLLIASVSNTPAFVALSGDATLAASGALTIASGSVTGAKLADNTVEEVDLEATNAPTDGYILSFSSATGGFTWVSSGSVGAGDITDVGSCTSGGCFIDGTNHTLTFEGSVVDASEAVLTVANPTADRTITLPDATGTVALLNGAQTFTSATWNGAAVAAQYGGTGINGAAAANGRVLIGNGSGYTLANMTQGTGITITNGAGSITIASTLGTDITGAEIADNTVEEVDFEATNAPTNGYILSYDSVTGGFTWIDNTGGTGSSKWTDSGTLIFLTDTTDDLAIGGTTSNASRFFFDVTTGNQIIFEGTGADDASETTLVVTNPTADRTITLPDATGTVALLNGAQTFTSATWNGTGISVAYGGTGASTFTSKGVLFGNGTSAIGATAAGTNGQLLLGVTSGNPAFATMSGDATITNAGVFTIGAGAITGAKIADNTVEEVDFEATNAPTNGYILSYDSVTGGFTWIDNTGGTGSSKWTDSGTLIFLTDTTDDLAIGGTTSNASRFFFDVTTGNQIIFEGTGADDASETTLVVTNPTADRTITLPDATGTVLLTGSSLLTLAATSGSGQPLTEGNTITIAAGAGITTTAGATDTVTVASTLGVSVDLTSEVVNTLPVANGGTGASTFTSKGVLFGNGTSAIGATAAGTNGQLLLGVTSGNPAFATMSGDATITAAGVLGIAANAVALTTDTVGNYVATITAGNGISGSSSSEGGAPTVALSALTADWNQTGSFDISLNNASSELKILESSGATFFGSFDVGDLSADQTYSFTTGGTVYTSGNDGAGSALDADLLDGQNGLYYSDLGNAIGVLAIASGGTNTTTIGDAGTIPYSDGTAYAFQTAAGTAGQALVSGATSAPTWYAPTIGSLLFAGISGALQQDNTNLFWDDTNNRLGIGTTTPGARLDVVANIASDYAAEFWNDGNDATRWGLLVQSGLDDGTAAGPSTLLQFQDGDGGAIGSITFGSGVTAYNTTSDIRLKENVSDTDLSIGTLMDVRVRDYEWKGDNENKITHGFVAQELNAVYPAAVTVPSDPAKMWQVDYSKLTPLIVKAIQDQQGAIESQELELIDLDLKTSANVTTLGALQASVDTQLSVIGDALAVLGAETDETRETLTALDSRVLSTETVTAAIQAQVAGHDASITELETKMATLADQNQALIEFFNAFELGSIVTADQDGNVDLLGGTLKARVLETGGIVVENVDEEAPTIGTAVIYPVAVDADADGDDDWTGLPMTDEEVTTRSGTVVRVMTKAMIPMTNGSQVFTSFGGNPGGFSWIEKYVDEHDEYVGFDVRLSEPTPTPVKVDWWLVERR